MLKKIIFIILLTNMANNNIDKPINYQDEDSATQDNLNIDWDFIKLREGNKNFGHQPTANSGITIGYSEATEKETITIELKVNTLCLYNLFKDL